MDVVCLGEMLIDMFPSESGVHLADVQSFQPKPGGAPANVAVGLARLGRQSAFIGKVGDDAFGRHLGRILAGEGVETRGLRFDSSARTTLAFIAKPDADTAEFLFYRNPGADTRLRVSELDREVLGHSKILHFGSLSLVEEPIRAAAKEAVDIVKDSGGKISLDVNYRPSLWGSAESAYREVMSIVPKINMLKVNEEELALLSNLDDLEAGSKKLIELGPEVVVVTLGPGGSYFRTADRCGNIPGFQVKTVDATGCGDAFIAGVLTKLIEVEREGQGWRDADWGSILRFGNGVGALTARTLGVIPALPNKQEVADFLTKNEGQRAEK
jgi:sugar/nucleoside kinase (ribokinase family)